MSQPYLLYEIQNTHILYYIIIYDILNFIISNKGVPFTTI